MSRPLKKDKRSGIALVLTALFLLILVPMIGLAVDGANQYMMRNQILVALDAAVLAGARSLSVGEVADQSANAMNTASAVFYSNVSNLNPQQLNFTFNATVNDNGSHLRTVYGTVTATMPLLLLGIINLGPTNITLTQSASKRDVNIMLVLDHSGSMAAAISTLQTDADQFVNMFTSGRDHVGLVTFTGVPVVAYPPQTTFKTDTPSVTNMIDSLTTFPYGAINTSAAIWAAYQQLVTLNEPGALNVIVLITGGLTNAYTADFTNYIPSTAGCASTPVNAMILTDQDESESIGLSDWQTTPALTSANYATALNDTPELRQAPDSVGCLGLRSLRLGIANYLPGLPTMDLNSNHTDGLGSISAYAPVNPVFTYADATNALNIAYASENALDDAANKIRIGYGQGSSPVIPLIDTIGLASNNPDIKSPDPLLLSRVSNANGATNSSQLPGLSIYAPSAGDLQAAFATIASQVVKLQ